jgi:hypothetical protein
MIVLGGILARFITVGVAGVGAFAMMTYALSNHWL